MNLAHVEELDDLDHLVATALELFGRDRARRMMAIWLEDADRHLTMALGLLEAAPDAVPALDGAASSSPAEAIAAAREALGRPKSALARCPECGQPRPTRTS